MDDSKFSCNYGGEISIAESFTKMKAVNIGG